MPPLSLRLTLIGLIWVSVILPVRAELSPSAYAQLKAEATEVLSVNVTTVTNVTETTEGDNCTLFFTVDAVVIDVNRTTVGFAVNDTIQFEAYTRDRSIEECQLFLGPAVPSLLEDGWCGLVYLNPPDEGSEVMNPAAYGQTFEEYTAQQCQAVAATGTSEPNDSMQPTSSNVSILSKPFVAFGSSLLVMMVIEYIIT